MNDLTSTATAALIACLVITWALGRTKLVGTLTVAGFVLGSIATVCVFVLLG